MDRRRFWGIAHVAVLLVALSAACLVPWRDHRVAPGFMGSVSGKSSFDEDAIRLTINHRENHTLFSVRETPLDANGRFEFDPLSLDIAGKEYSKFYRVFLYLEHGAGREGDRSRLIWRADFSRRRTAGPITLECDLARPISRGQPCRVNDPAAHPWLIDRGEATFRELCSGCHGKDATGLPGAGPDLHVLSSRTAGVFARDEIADWIEGRWMPEAHDRGGMPIWGERLSAEYDRYANPDELVGARLDPVLAYLESIQAGR